MEYDIEKMEEHWESMDEVEVEHWGIMAEDYDEEATWCVQVVLKRLNKVDKDRILFQ